MGNIVADGKGEQELIQRLFDILEKMLFQGKKTVEAKYAKIIADHLAFGGQASYKLIERRMEAKMKKALDNAKIPYFVTYDNVGNSAFIVRDKDEQTFCKIQHDVFSMDAAYYAQTPLTELTRIAKNNGEKELIKLTFDTQADFDEAQIKLYNSSIVCAFGSDDRTLYVNPSDLYKENGSDMITFELEWAANQSMNDSMFGNEKGSDGKKLDTDFQKLRDAQAHHDMQMIKAFSEAVQNGEKKVLIDATNGSKNYMESGLDGLHIYAMDEKDGTFKEKHFISRKSLLQSYKEDGIGSLVSKWGFDVKNAIVIDAEDKNHILNSSKEQAMSWSKEWANQKTADGKPIPIRNGFNRQLRPVGEFQGKDAEINRMKTHDVRKVLHDIENAARRQVNLLGLKSNLEKRNHMKSIIADLIQVAVVSPQNTIPEIKNFLDSPNNYMTREEKLKWLVNIKDHFIEENEKDCHELYIETIKTKEAEKDARESKRDKEAKKEEKQTERAEEPQHNEE